MTPLPEPTIFTFALAHWPYKDGPRTRASKPKVRTGCITCKRRRVKCDEAKPECQNCARRKISCEGYITKPRTTTPPPKASLLIKPNYETLVFANQLQKDHFDRWLRFARETLIFPSELITETIPQIARSAPAIKNAAFAIGAASLGTSSREQRLRGSGPFYEDALRYYNRALRLTSSSPTTDESTPRVLVACLLFFVFEALRGNRKAALIHLNHGTRVLDQYVRRAARLGMGMDRTPLLAAIAANTQRLTMQSWSHNGDHPEETEMEVPWCCKGRSKRYAVDEIPDQFDSIDEAHRWWEVTAHYVIRHAPLIIGFRVEGTGSKAPTTYPPNQNLPISAAHVKEHIHFIERWQANFTRLLLKTAERRRSSSSSSSSSSVPPPNDDRERLKTLGLQIHSIYLSIPVKTANYTDPEALALLTSAFREVVTLSERFLEIQQQQRQQRNTSWGEIFTIESNSPTWPLGAAAMLCADEAVRADAIRLLRRFPRRDGLWDTQAYVAMLEGVEEAKRTIISRVGDGGASQHVFNYEVVFDETSISWVKTVEHPAAVARDAFEYKMELP